jgi:hypothetical protein
MCLCLCLCVLCVCVCHQIVTSTTKDFHPISLSCVFSFLFVVSQSDYINYVEGFLLAPGFIDLSELQFVAVTLDGSSYDPVEDFLDYDDIPSEETNGDNNDDDEGRGGNRHLDQQDFYMEGSALDIAIFFLPESCASSRTGCDWTELGIGARSEDKKDLQYCCTSEAMSIGLCSGTQKGRLIMDAEKFKGKVGVVFHFPCRQLRTMEMGLCVGLIFCYLPSLASTCQCSC